MADNIGETGMRWRFYLDEVDRDLAAIESRADATIARINQKLGAMNASNPTAPNSAGMPNQNGGYSPSVPTGNVNNGLNDLAAVGAATMLANEKSGAAKIASLTSDHMEFYRSYGIFHDVYGSKSPMTTMVTDADFTSHDIERNLEQRGQGRDAYNKFAKRVYSSILYGPEGAGESGEAGAVGGINANGGNAGSIPSGTTDNGKGIMASLATMKNAIQGTGALLAANFAAGMAEAGHKYKMEMISAGQDTIKQNLAGIHNVNNTIDSTLGSIPLLGGPLANIAKAGYGVFGGYEAEQGLNRDMQWRDYNYSYKAQMGEAKASGIEAEASRFPVAQSFGKLLSLDAAMTRGTSALQAEKSQAVNKTPNIDIDMAGGKSGEGSTEKLLAAGLSADQINAANISARARMQDAGINGNNFWPLYVQDLNKAARENSAKPYDARIANMAKMTAEEKENVFTTGHMNIDYLNSATNAQNITNTLRPTAGLAAGIFGKYDVEEKYKLADYNKANDTNDPGGKGRNLVRDQLKAANLSAQSQVGAAESELTYSILMGRGTQFDPRTQSVAANQDVSPETLGDKMAELTHTMQKLVDRFNALPK